jgi:hypothetical protein
VSNVTYLVTGLSVVGHGLLVVELVTAIGLSKWADGYNLVS